MRYWGWSLVLVLVFAFYFRATESKVGFFLISKSSFLHSKFMKVITLRQQGNRNVAVIRVKKNYQTSYLPK